MIVVLSLTQFFVNLYVHFLSLLFSFKGMMFICSNNPAFKTKQEKMLEPTDALINLLVFILSERLGFAVE